MVYFDNVIMELYAAMTRRHTNICLVESRWWKATNISVRNTFELIADIHVKNPNAYEYEMANSRSGFKESVGRQLQIDKINYLSIATHGSEEGLSLFNEQDISRTILRNLLSKDVSRNLSGLHIGACSAFNARLAEYLFDGDISAWWIAGYGAEIDWVASTSLDFMFFHKIMMNDNHGKDGNPLETIELVCEELKEEVGGLIEKLQFQVYSFSDRRKFRKLI